jgi:hypothetical protein
MIEREVPTAGKLSTQELKDISKKSSGIVDGLGKNLQWIESYITDDKIYCVYRSADEKLIKEHANLCEIPANKISRIRAVIDPTTGE